MRVDSRWISLAALACISIGCATKKYVKTETGETERRVGERITGVEGQVEEAQERLDEHGRQIDEVSGTARDALERAMAAGKLAEGKFLYETVLSDDRVRFAVDEAELSPEAAAAIDAFAEEIKARNENVYVEVQGHTDSTGDETYNIRLGESRAEAVRRYLAGHHGFALHRISMISYGEAAPVADNGTKEGRASNRRVVLVVLK
jgi:outer membrane protein OmpA-like peptidoglycan-associated protein